jgi:hypothetical protein
MLRYDPLEIRQEQLVVVPQFIMKINLLENRPFADGRTRAATMMSSSYGGTTHSITIHPVSERPTTIETDPLFGVEEKKDDVENAGSKVHKQYPWPSTPTKQLPTSHYFYQPETPVYEELWERLCPPLESSTNWMHWKQDRESLGDFGGSWTQDEDPYVVAETIARQCAPMTLMSDEGTIKALATCLTESLRTYLDFCKVHVLANRHHHDQHHHHLHHQNTHNDDDNNNENDHHNEHKHKHNHVRLKYRLMITRGEDGVKCPLFHYDNVPVRWIQTFVGPGVELVMDGVGVQWDTFHSFDHEEE